MEARTCDFCKRTCTKFKDEEIYNVEIYPYVNSHARNASDCEDYDICASCLKKWFDSMKMKRSNNDE